jgi:hypothetical protein
MRLPEMSGSPSFEQAIADVLGAPEPAVEPPPGMSEPVAAAAPVESATTAAPPTPGQATGVWSQTPVPPAMVEVPGSRAPWIILAVLGFFWFFCCGCAFIVFAVDAAG